MGVLDGVAIELSAVTRAQILQQRAATVGFDWPDVQPVLDKINEELAELKSDMEAGSAHDKLLDEMGDVLFACINLARHLHIDAEEALRSGNRKFERRFAFMENELANHSKEMKQCVLEELEALWGKAKLEE